MKAKSCYFIPVGQFKAKKTGKVYRTVINKRTRHQIGENDQPVCQRQFKFKQEILFDTKEPDCEMCVERAKWLTWDWSKFDAELAREVGLTRERIRQIRKIIHIDPAERGWEKRSRISREEREKWDWTKTNAELAKEHDYDQNTVYTFRKELGKPKVKAEWPRKKWTDEKCKALFNFILTGEPGLGRRCDEFGTNLLVAHQLYRKHGKRLGFVWPDYRVITNRNKKRIA